MAIKSYRERFIIKPAEHFKLKDADPAYTEGQKDIADITNEDMRLRQLQYLLHAEHRHSLLIVLQGLDASGKDGTIRHVLGYMNPLGCRVQAFRQPTEEEAAHDFLWRAHRAVPAKGEVAIFNRSHYEDVLVVRVHEQVSATQWQTRFDDINNFERLLAANGTHILKFFLHISPEEQLHRFKKRLDDPARWWKISEADYSERRYWSAYQQAYEDVLNRCSTEQAPWFVIPADHKWFRNRVISRIVVETLESLNMQFPQASVDIDAIRHKYHQAKDSERDAI